MVLEYLCNVGYRTGHEIGAYLVGIQEDLNAIRNKNIYLFGAGENGFLAMTILQEKGIRISGYVDNNERMAGKHIGKHEIFSARKMLDDNDAYFVICVNEKNIASVRLQLLVNRIKSFSIFARMNGHSFASEDVLLHQAVMEGINTICFNDEDYQSALPQCGFSLGGDGSKIGNINWLVKSTEWSYPGYQWIKNYLSNKNECRVLEIGPGFGLMSYVFLSIFPKINITWILFGNNQKHELDLLNDYENGLHKVSEKYKGRVDYRFGRIERDKDLITEKYDLIIMTEVFEHFALNPVPTMKMIGYSLNYDGRLLLTTPNWGHLPTFATWKDLPEDNETDETRYGELLKCGHVYQYDYDEMMEVIKESGFEIESYELSESNNHNFFLKKNN